MEDCAKSQETSQLKAESMLSLPQDCNLILGDCRSVDKQIQDCSVAMIFTDPFYNQEALPLYGWLGRFALRGTEARWQSNDIRATLRFASNF